MKEVGGKHHKGREHLLHQSDLHSREEITRSACEAPALLRSPEGVGGPPSVPEGRRRAEPPPARSAGSRPEELGGTGGGGRGDRGLGTGRPAGRDACASWRAPPAGAATRASPWEPRFGLQAGRPGRVATLPAGWGPEMSADMPHLDVRSWRARPLPPRSPARRAGSVGTGSAAAAFAGALPQPVPSRTRKRGYSGSRAGGGIRTCGLAHARPRCPRRLGQSRVRYLVPCPSSRRHSSWRNAGTLYSLLKDPLMGWNDGRGIVKGTRVGDLRSRSGEVCWLPGRDLQPRPTALRAACCHPCGKKLPEPSQSRSLICLNPLWWRRAIHHCTAYLRSVRGMGNQQLQ